MTELLNKRSVALPDGSVRDNYSPEYMRYCEAKTMAKWSLEKRRNFLAKLKDKNRIDELKSWLSLIWKTNQA